MKKTITLFIAGLLSAAGTFAQPTLTAATSIPSAGYSYQLLGNNNFTPSTGGANQTWDFTGQTYSAITTQTYSACGGAYNCSAFPGSNLINTTAGTGDMYLMNTGNTSSIKGVVGGGTSLLYTDPEDMFRFPMTYNSNFVDPFAVTFVGGSATFYRSGNDSTIADGYGTLKTPAGTFTNVLRVKRVETYRDSANLGGVTLISTYKSSIYVWYDAIHKDLLFTTSTLTTTQSGGSVTTLNTTKYASGQRASGINEVNGTDFTWNVHPNPAKGQAQVAVNLKAAASMQISITDFTGRIVKQLPAERMTAGEHQVNVSLEGMAAGMYLVRMATEESAATAKLVVE